MKSKAIEFKSYKLISRKDNKPLSYDIITFEVEYFIDKQAKKLNADKISVYYAFEDGSTVTSQQDIDLTAIDPGFKTFGYNAYLIKNCWDIIQKYILDNYSIDAETDVEWTDDDRINDSTEGYSICTKNGMVVI